MVSRYVNKLVDKLIRKIETFAEEDLEREKRRMTGAGR